MNNESLLDDVITTEGSMEVQSAGLGIRFANLFIDGIILNILQYAIGFILDMIDPTLSILLSLGTYFAYYIALESSTGQTIGKMITGTTVVDEFGQKIDGGKAAIRTLCRIIPFEPFSFFGSSRRGWHDSISKTYVIKKPSY